MTDVHVHVTVWDDTAGDDTAAGHGSAAAVAAPPALFVHGVLSWGTDDRYGFGAQRPLAADRRLLMMDRRGFGASPDTVSGRSDYEADADDIIGLLDRYGGGHLVGHSYGGVAAMLAAGRRPDLVRSLALIQPGAMRPAERHPVVAEMLERARAAGGADGAPPGMTPEEFIRASTEGLGLPVPDATPDRLRAARTSMRERPCWDADVPLEPLATAPWPTLIITGTWEGAPELYHRYAGEPLMAAAGVIAEEIGAEHVRVPGFYPQVDQPALVNDALRGLWTKADRATVS
ncbi:alpha/beta fold hydrolase [Spirillospora sp. CA-255316]